jgi:hypothetical protein
MDPRLPTTDPSLSNLRNRATRIANDEHALGRHAVVRRVGIAHCDSALSLHAFMLHTIAARLVLARAGGLAR